MAIISKGTNTESLCELCGTHEAVVVQPSWGVVRCSRCGLIYSENRTVPPDLYEEAYTQRGKIATYEFDGERYKFRARRFWRALFERLAKYRKCGRLLDVGCGLGFLLDLARQLGWEPYGLEVSAYASQYAREHFGLTVHHGALEDNTYPPESFDAVVCSHVLKHVPTPRNFLRRIHDILRPGGVLLLLVPTPFSSLSYKLFGRLHGPGPPVHLFFFSAHTLSLLLHQQGFEVLKRTVNTQLVNTIGDFTKDRELEAKMARVSEDVVGADQSTLRQRLRNLAVSAAKGTVNALGSLLGFGDEVIIFARKRPM